MKSLFENILFQNIVTQPVSIKPLALFRILFGFMMLVSTIRFMYLGWIDYQFIDSNFHFKYYGFEWIQPLSRTGMYLIYSGMIISSVGIMLGYYYRIASLYFFLAFTYCELIDKSYYLNHYYFVSVVSLLMIVLPANHYASLDIALRKIPAKTQIPAWCINLVKFQLGLVYFYAGLAKLNYDWLINAMPLKIWLPAQSHLPLIGWLFQLDFMPYLFSWAGAFFDLFIVFVLLSRFWYVGYLFVIVFHILTGIFFQIGMFPIIMICCVPIFFPEYVHQYIFNKAQKLSIKIFPSILNNSVVENYQFPSFSIKPLVVLLSLHVIFQIIFPWRFVLYPGNLFWTEEGYRFGWRVMLMEKAGYTTFYIKDGENGKEGMVVNSDFLNSHQEKQMAMQPDMILEFAHFLGKHYKNQGMKNPIVRAEAFVTLNGSRSKLLANPTVNLLAKQESLKPKDWLMPF